MFQPFQKFMKRPQTKFDADTMSHSKVIRSKKKSKFTFRSKFSCSCVFFSLSIFYWSYKNRLRQNFLAAEFFLIINILLKLQKQILNLCKF